MAEATAFRNNALPYPVYGVTFTVVYPMLDADGDLVTGATTPDAERSLNGDTFADCTNESTEIATNSGMYYLTLTAAEMTADIVTVIAKSATAGMKTTCIVLYPRKLPILATGTCQGANDTGDIQLASGEPAVDDFYNGCLCVAVIDSTTEARIINDYVGSTKVGEVSPAWNTAVPDNNDTYTIYLPEGRQLPSANVVAYSGTANPSAHTAGYPVVTIKDGTGTGEINTNAGAIAVVDLATAVTTVNGLAANVITAAATAADFSTEVNAAVLAVLGALNDAAADGAVTTTDTMVAYLKQIINTLEGAPGIPTWPAAAAPGNAVSIAEAVRHIYDQIGTAGVALTEAGGDGDHLTAINLPNQTMDIVGNITGNLSGSVGSVTAAVATTSNIKKNTALAAFAFLMTDSTTHAPATGKTVTVTRSINGGAFGAGTLSAVAEVSAGLYTVDFASGDLNGNVIVLRATAASCDDTFERIVTVP